MNILLEALIVRDLVEICGHHFLTRRFGPQALVVDLGANRGEFARQVQRGWDVRCLSIEANPLLCETWSGQNEVINAAVSDREGKLDFYICDKNSESSSLFQRKNGNPNCSVQVPAMTLERIMGMARSSTADLVKIDIEGAEIQVLMGASEATLCGFQQICVEFHDFALPEIGAADVEAVKRRLHELGFWSISFSRRNTDVLFINKCAGLVTELEIEWLRYVVSNVRGATRVARRWLGRRV